MFVWEQVTCGLLHEPMTNQGKVASGNGQSQERSVYRTMLPGETVMFTRCCLATWPAVTHETSSLSQHHYSPAHPSWHFKLYSLFCLLITRMVPTWVLMIAITCHACPHTLFQLDLQKYLNSYQVTMTCPTCLTGVITVGMNV